MKSRTLSFSAIPFLRLLIPYAGGVLLFHVYSSFLISVLISALLSFTGLIIFLFFRKKDTPLRTFSFFLFGFFALFSSGALNTFIHTPRSDSNNQTLTGFWNGEVVAINNSRKNTMQCDVLLKGFRADSNENFIPIKEKARLYIRQNDKNSLISGERISFHASLNYPRNNGNPGEFDYAGWLLQKGFRRTGFVDSSLWQSTSGVNSSLISQINRKGDQLKSKIRSLIPDTEQANLLIALLLGDKTELREEQKALFRHNGISHLLAVSGFHVGLIYSILLSCFFFIPRNTKAGKYIRGLVLIILWFYALLTGATPSVLRATFMITLFVAGSLIGKKGFTLNTLCVAAFCLLIIQPYTLFDIGFQLSFVSVTGILLSQIILSDWLTRQKNGVRSIIGFISVCIAAQIATLPLTLYYFGAFSPYFLIGNLIAIPVIYLILFLSIPYLCIYICFETTRSYADKILKALFDFLNQMLSTVESFPYSYPDTIRPTPEQTALLYVLLITLVITYINKSRKGIYPALILFTLLFFPFRELKLDARAQIQILNNIPHHTLFVCNKNEYTVISTQKSNNETAMAERYFGITKAKHQPGSSCISVSDRKILFLDTDTLRYATSEKALAVDFLVLKRGCKGDLTKINQIFSPQILILDGSLSSFWREKWLREASDAGIICYDMKENGAFSYFFH